MRLGGCTWEDLAHGTPPRLLLPLGATEQHGTHLPLSTDTVIASAVAEGAARDRSDVAVGPALPYGASGEHAAFPGTLSLGAEVMETAVVELVRSADHFADVVLVSWHGGNADAVARAVACSRADGRTVSCWEPRLPGDGTDAHAGRSETSLMLAIAPEMVGDPRPSGPAEPLTALLPRLREHGVRAVSASGVLGDARDASAAEG
ncbi:MAG: mycofactocin biosynthesis peptidyl-dipeptidase MftE, partial [Solirubrobacteraceae bacterium]